ncbi:MAG: exo-rhamnogalacturonan lyase family protein, partial [Kiritimatiellia bacterium]
VRTGKPLTPSVAVKVQETEERITVTTGPAEFVVNKRQFSLLESVKLGPTRIAGPGEVTLINSEGQKFQAGPPTRVLWEYRGPLRVTLRVEGPYTGAGGEYTAYTTRLTFIAGSSAVRISHSIRNSHPTDGFDALIKQATLGLALASFGTDQGRGKDWAACGDGKFGVLMVERHTAGCFPAGLHQFTLGTNRLEVWVVPEAPRERKKLVGYGEGFFALADLAHKDSEIWLDFYTGSRDAPANEEQAKRLRSKLIALADGAWISETATLTCGKFGTLEDEIATYQRWGWKGWDDEKKRAPARKPHIPDAHVEKVDIHDESESDSVELFMLMFVRTGERGFFDLGEAYAGYYRGHAVWRTDGFEYDGFRHERAGVVAKSKRKSTALGHGWYSPKEYGWSDSRFHMCHQWATGLIDYYCLTGDTDALEAGLDWTEYAAATYPEQKPGQRHGWGRAWGRSFGIIVRAYQVTRDPKWKAIADVFAGVATRAPNRRPDGLYEERRGFDDALFRA